MKKVFCLVLALMVMVSFGQFSYALEHGGKEHAGGSQVAKEHGGKEHGGKEEGDKEHGGKEHGGKEHGGKAAIAPSAKEIRQAMKAYVTQKSLETGTFDIYYPVIGAVAFLLLHELGKGFNFLRP